MQHFILRALSRPSRRGHHPCRRYRTFHGPAAAADDAADSTVFSSIKWVRDRALDHAVEKERDLKPMLNIKNLLNSEPSKSLPLSIIADNKASLGIPIRPVEFVRKYPSVFHEFLPGGIGIHPHVKLTPEILALDAEEQLLFQSESHQQDVANRLLKLLMLSRINKIPLCIIDRLKWDLGLPHDYTQTVVPQFPDYFQVTSSGNELELVCWSDEVAVSVMEKKSMTLFPLQYSRGFEVDKKFKKWVDDWQKLPYISPYENAMHLQAKSDESDKWVVGLLHELLHLLVPKKTEKDNLLSLGEYLGVRSRFKRALLQHPGIFYVSSKLGTHTVVLREAYKRDLLIGKPQHLLMTLRSKHIHLMNTVKEENKLKNLQVDGSQKQKVRRNSNKGEEEESESESESEDNENEEGEDATLSSLSDSGLEDVTDDESDNVVSNGRRPTKEMKFQEKMSSKHARNLQVQEDRSNRSNDYEDGNGKGGGRTRTAKFSREVSGSDMDKFSNGSERGRGRGRGRTASYGSRDSREDNDNGRERRTARAANFRGEISGGDVDRFSNRSERGRGRTAKYGSTGKSYRNSMEDDGGRGTTRNDQNMDSGSNRRRDTRGTNPPRFLRTEAHGGRSSGVSRTPEGRF